VRLLPILFAGLAAAFATALDQPPRAPLVIAHRGASWDAPEHTFASWDLALSQGIEWIEQDAQLTRDGALIVFHDDSLDRVARGDSTRCIGLVADRTLAELRSCDVGSWFNAEYPERAKPEFENARIPTLDAVLSRYRDRARFDIETKRPVDTPAMEDSLVALLRRHGLAGAGGNPSRVRLSSFSAASLRRLARLAPEISRVRLLEDRIPVDSLDGILDEIATYAHGIGPSRRILSPQMIEAAHRRGLLVHVYTVNDSGVIAFMRRAGVDGIFTDRPGLAREIFARP
jgi:glycerophosphoryl diester phosphodiesterase